MPESYLLKCKLPLPGETGPAWVFVFPDKARFRIKIGESFGPHEGHLSATQIGVFMALAACPGQFVGPALAQIDRHYRQAIAEIRNQIGRALEENYVREGRFVRSGSMSETMKTWIVTGRGVDQGKYQLTTLVFQEYPESMTRADRLFRSFGSGSLLSDQPPVSGEVPWLPPRRVLLLYAAERAVFNSRGQRKVLGPCERPPQGWKWTADELSGDTIAVSRASACLSAYGLVASALPPHAASQESRKPASLLDGASLFFVGSEHANAMLHAFEDADRLSYGYGARFGDAQRAEGALEVNFTRSNGRVRRWRVKHHSPRRHEFAILRRWRTPQGHDALLAAGMTAQGTRAAVEFLCNPQSIDDLFKFLLPRQCESGSVNVEFTQFDAVLRVPIRHALLDPDAPIGIIDGEVRQTVDRYVTTADALRMPGCE